MYIKAQETEAQVSMKSFFTFCFLISFFLKKYYALLQGEFLFIFHDELDLLGWGFFRFLPGGCFCLDMLGYVVLCCTA